MHLDYQEEYKAVKNNIDWGERIWILRPELKKNLVITYTQSSAKPSFLSVVLLGTLHTELLNDLWSWLQFIVCDGLMRLSAVNCYRKTKHPWRPDKKLIVLLSMERMSPCLHLLNTGFSEFSISSLLQRANEKFLIWIKQHIKHL